MKKNVGNVDMIIRLVLGVAIGVWGLIAQNWLGLIGLVPIITGLTGFCPAFTLLGINTCKVKE